MTTPRTLAPIALRISRAVWALGREFLELRIASNTASARGATTHGSVTASKGGVSMRMKSKHSRRLSSNSLKRDEVNNSAGFGGNGPLGSNDNPATPVATK